MKDITAITAELHHVEMRLVAAEKHIEVLTKQRDEAEEKRMQAEAKAAAYGKDTARLMAERDSWKASAQKMIADRTFAEEGEHG